MEAKDREITLLNEQITKLQHMETTSDNKVTEYAYKIDKGLFRVCIFPWLYITLCVCVVCSFIPTVTFGCFLFWGCLCFLFFILVSISTNISLW